MKPLKVLVNMVVEQSEMDSVISSLVQLEPLEELYETAGGCDIVAMISASDMEEARNIVRDRIMTIKGVRSTVSSNALRAHKMRG